MTENKKNQDAQPIKKPNYTLRRFGALAAATVVLAGGGKAIESALDQPARDAQEQAEDPYTITSPPAEAGEGTDDLVQKVFPNANDLPDGVIKVEQLGKDDSILGEGERAKISVPDDESFRIARGINEQTGPSEVAPENLPPSGPTAEPQN